MHRFLRVVIGVSLFALIGSTVLLGGGSTDFKGVALNSEPAVCAAIQAVVAIGGHSTGDFCDSGAHHGTSASCKTAGRAQGLFTCANGASPSNIDCSLSGNSCDNGNGSWCSCTFDCIKAVAIDPEPVEPPQ